MVMVKLETLFGPKLWVHQILAREIHIHPFRMAYTLSDKHCIHLHSLRFDNGGYEVRS